MPCPAMGPLRIVHPLPRTLLTAQCLQALSSLVGTYTQVTSVSHGFRPHLLGCPGWSWFSSFRHLFISALAGGGVLLPIVPAPYRHGAVRCGAVPALWASESALRAPGPAGTFAPPACSTEPDAWGFPPTGHPRPFPRPSSGSPSQGICPVCFLDSKEWVHQVPCGVLVRTRDRRQLAEVLLRPDPESMQGLA